MPDISKCIGNGCEIKEQCYRYTVKPSEQQSWADFETELDDEKCVYFIKAKEKRND